MKKFQNIDFSLWGNGATSLTHILEIALFSNFRALCAITSSTKKATEKAAAPKLKLKILCLHGYRQTSTTFYEKTGAFRKMVGKLCDLVLIDAPHLVPPEAHGLSASEVTEEQRGWWFSQPHGYFKVWMFL